MTLLNIYRYSRALQKHTGQLSLQNMSIRDHLSQIGCPADTIEHYLVPIASAIWSCDNWDSGDIPASAYISFFSNYGRLDLFNRPHWYTIKGGSKEYINNFETQFKGCIMKHKDITNVRENDGKVVVASADNSQHVFDKVIIATHADTALQIVTSLTDTKASILQSHRYTHNHVFLHTDANLMPIKQEV